MLTHLKGNVHVRRDTKFYIIKFKDQIRVKLSFY
jgi:hypothetical protein